MVPMALTNGVLPTGLPAPAFRAFVMLVSLANDNGFVDILKPELERLISTRIDNATRFLEPLRESVIDMPGIDHDSVGEPWFESVEYLPGEQKRLAGVIRLQLSGAARSVLASIAYPGTVAIAADEFRRLSTVPGIIVYLRCRRLISAVGKAAEIQERFDDAGLFQLFGQYSAAAVSNKRKADGEIGQTLSISRMTDTLLEPAVQDVRRHVDDVVVVLSEGRPEGGGRGRRWSHVDLLIAPRPKRLSVRDIDAMMTEKQRHRSEIADRRAGKTA